MGRCIFEDKLSFLSNIQIKDDHIYIEGGIGQNLSGRIKQAGAIADLVVGDYNFALAAGQLDIGDCEGPCCVDFRLAQFFLLTTRVHTSRGVDIERSSSHSTRRTRRVRQNIETGLGFWVSQGPGIDASITSVPCAIPFHLCL